MADPLRSNCNPANHPSLSTSTECCTELDERRQRAFVRYYVDAGAGGLAVGVHTTQFAIRDPQHWPVSTCSQLAPKS